LSVASAQWATETNPTTDAIVSAKGVSIIGAGILKSHEIFDGEVAGARVFAAVDIGLSARHVLGDIASPDNDSLRTALLGTPRRRFGGLELGLSAQINSVRADITYYYYRRGAANGLFGGQIIAGFGIQSNVFSGALKPRNGT